MGMPRRPDQQFDPPGAVTPPSPQAGIFRGRLVVVSGSGSNTGLFVYSGTPALGNAPILAITTASVDPYGNTVTPSTITDGGAPLLIYSSSPASGNMIASVANMSGTDSFGNAYVSGVTSYVSPTNFARLSGDTLTFSVSGTGWPIQVQPGNNALFFAGASAGGTYLNADGFLVAANPGGGGSPEVWHTMTPLAAGFAAGATTPRYRLEPVGTGGITPGGGVVRLAGFVALTANEAANTTFFTLPAGWRPSVAQSLVGVNNLSGFGLLNSSVNVTTGGALQLGVAGSNTNIVGLDGMTFPLD